MALIPSTLPVVLNAQQLPHCTAKHPFRTVDSAPAGRMGEDDCTAQVPEVWVVLAGHRGQGKGWHVDPFDYRTSPTPSLNYFDFCCGQGEFRFLSARQNLVTACG